ncbi:MAG: ABC transporter ATP-binding protein, partial [Chloroflexota bacterium]
MSGGQRQRLSVALALINYPDIVFLDEPTTGLDPQARRSMWDTIKQIQGEGATVFLTTHYMEEAEALCDRVAIIDDGKIIALDMPEKLVTQNFNEAAVEFEDLVDMPAEGTFSAIPGVSRTRRIANIITLYTADTTATLSGLMDLANAG